MKMSQVFKPIDLKGPQYLEMTKTSYANKHKNTLKTQRTQNSCQIRKKKKSAEWSFFYL
jgi:hypothetical protein